MPFPKMTTRRWMIAVAVAAGSVGATITVRRALRYDRCAAFHAAKERISLKHAENPRAGLNLCEAGWGVPALESDPCIGHPLPPRLWSATDHLADAAFHRIMKRRYERAARRPWLPVPPDPPDPE